MNWNQALSDFKYYLKIERGLRREAGRLMAYIGVYAVEALDDALP